MIDVTRLKNDLFKQHALPLLTKKQAENWYRKDWTKISKKKAYLKALVDIETKVELEIEKAYDLHEELTELVKKELPEGFKFTSDFYTHRWPGFYKTKGTYQAGGNNCVNCMMCPDSQTYMIFGTDGYHVGELLGLGKTADEAAKIGLEWLEKK